MCSSDLSEGLRTRNDDGVSPSRSLGENQCPISNAQSESKLNLPPPFSSIQAFNGLDDAHQHWGGPSALLSPPTEMPISSGNILTNTPRKKRLTRCLGILWPSHVDI